MQARPAVSFRQFAIVANVGKVAPFAEVEVRLELPRWRNSGSDDPARLLDQPKRDCRIVFQPLTMQIIIVLVFGDIERAFKPREVHVCLHLCEMLWLAQHDAALFGDRQKILHCVF